MEKLVTVDRSWVEFETEITSQLDEIDEEVIIADGVAEVHRGIYCVPSDNTPKKRVSDLPNGDKEINKPFDKLSTPTDVLTEP